MKKRGIDYILSSLLAMLFLFCGCDASVEEYSENSILNPLSDRGQQPSSSMTASSAPQYSKGLEYDDTGCLNRLTGQYNLPSYMVNKRPVSVVINNYRSALPHNGLSAADVVFECEAEGGITRFLALYSDWYNAPKVGSIREARLHFLRLAQSFDSIMVHFGSSAETAAAIKSDGYTTLDGMKFSDNQLTYRDEELKATRNTEHTVVTTGEMIKNTVNSRSIREDYESAALTYFNFTPRGELIIPQAYRARNIYLPVGMEAEYNFDTESGQYLRSSAGQPQTDLNNGERIAVTNVLVLLTKQYKNVSDETLVTVELAAGEGYYFSMGYGQKIYWQKEEGVYGRIILYDEKGSQITINQGKTWVNIISDTLKDKVIWTEIG